jgi:GDPmannose 4,6-dehydratase
LNICFSKISKKWQEYTITDPSYISEYKILVSDPSKIKNLGWEPLVSFEELAEMMLQNEFSKVKK